jgi:uncharacterized protein YecE (DUF72 family)
MTGDLFAAVQFDEFAELARRLPPVVYFGTSSWNYPGWQGLVYHELRPSRTNSAALLEEYARFPLFRTVGIDSTFYTPATPDTLRRYAERLPAGFPCVSKVWDRLTIHTFSKLKDPKRAGERNPDFLNPELFLEAIYDPCDRHFRGHTGPFVFEFQAIGRGGGVDADRFCELLDRFFEALPREGRYAVELRNEEFLTPGYFAVLARHRVAHLFNSWTRMPPIGAQLDLPNAVTGEFLVARALLRPGRYYDDAVDAFAPYDRIREPVPELREDLLRLMRLAVERDLPAYILVNNRAEGSSPLTIAAIARMWAEMRADTG